MPINITHPEAHKLMNCFYVTCYSQFSANRASIIKREHHILEISERFKEHFRHFILRSCEHVTVHLNYFPISGWPNLNDWLKHRCYEVSRTQNSDCNSETRASMYLDKNICRLIFCGLCWNILPSLFPLF
jgi:hypothetical protein